MKKGEATKLRIIQATIDMAYDNGFESINFGQVAKICEISQPALYKYFKNKLDLLGDTLLYCAEKGRNFIDLKVSEDTDALQKLNAYIKGNLEWSQVDFKEAQIMKLLYYYSNHSEKLKATFDIITDTGIKRINSILLAGSREKIWNLKESISHASIIQNILIGEILKRSINPGLKINDSSLLKIIHLQLGNA